MDPLASAHAASLWAGLHVILLLVLSVLVTPAAAALRISSSPVLVPVLSVVFAVTSMVGGIMLALGGSIPISPYVTTISFLIIVVCLVISKIRGRARATA